jgi:hypothetical protein
VRRNCPGSIALLRDGGAVKLFGVECDEVVAGCGVALIRVVSASRRKADYVIPASEAGGHFSTVGIGAAGGGGDGSGVISH